MELTVGDLVLHTNNEKMGYGLVLSPTVMACDVQIIAESTFVKLLRRGDIKIIDTTKL